MATKNTTTEDQEHSEAIAEATKSVPAKVMKVSEELSCELNDVEWNSRARELADSIAKHESEVQRKKDVMKQIGTDVSKAAAQVTKLSNIVSTRREQRQVTVEVKYDYEAGTVTQTRTDTNEMISERAMTDNERQAELDLQDANAFIEGRHEADGSPFDDDAADAVDADISEDELEDDSEQTTGSK